jgi:hypothetical protein
MAYCTWIVTLQNRERGGKQQHCKEGTYNKTMEAARVRRRKSKKKRVTKQPCCNFAIKQALCRITLFVPGLGGTRGVVAMAGDGPSRGEESMHLGLLALMIWLVVGLCILLVAIISGNDCVSGAGKHRDGGTCFTACGVR